MSPTSWRRRTPPRSRAGGLTATSRTTTLRTCRRPALLAAPAQLGVERVEPLLPERAERAQPGVDLRQGRRVDRVEPATAVGADRGEAALTDHLELHRDGGLADPELL